MLDELALPERVDVLRHLLVLGIAYLLAMPIAWNREHAERSAGLRTFSLVAVSCCGFIQAAEMRLGGDPDAMSKVIEGLITGIGFIGGGAILRTGATVKGTATAASLWATGAIGTAVGLGAYDVAVVISVLTMSSLIILPRIDGGASPKKQAEAQKRAEDTHDA